MVNVYVQSPHWFLGVDASLEAFAALISFCVALAALRAYHITQERKYGVFTASMALLTLSFLSRAVADALLEELLFHVSAEAAKTIFYIGYVSHILLALSAYLMLIFVTHKVTDRRIMTLLLLITVPSLLLSGSYFMSFYGLSAIFLAFIAFAYYQNYRKVCKFSACLVFWAFLLLTIAQVIFVFPALLSKLAQLIPLIAAAIKTLGISSPYFYASAHIAQALGYFALLFALLRTRLK